MRRRIIYVFLTACLGLLAGCTHNTTHSDAALSVSEQTVADTTEETDDTTEASTGYPTGTVQRSYIMVNDVLYVDSDSETVSRLPDSFISIGTVSEDNIYEKPSANFEASRIEKGTMVYANPESYDTLYIPVSDGKYRQFIPE